MARRSTDALAIARPEYGAMIAERAYYRAEKRGFAPGRELEDWLAAEREIADLKARPRGAAPAKTAEPVPPKKPSRPRKSTTVKKIK